MLSQHRQPIMSLPPERQGAAAACQEEQQPEPIRPLSFTPADLVTTSALLSTPAAAVGVPPAQLPGQSSPARPATASSDDLPLRIRDAVVAAQWSAKNTDPHAPLGLSPAALLASTVCDAQRDADAVVRALVKAGVLRAETHEPDTTKIGPRLTHQVKVLPVRGVKLLAVVLFFWEDEVVRLRRYADEQAELEVALGRLQAERVKLDKHGDGAVVGGGDAAQDTHEDQDEEEEPKEERERLEKMTAEVQFRIRAIELRKKVKPSERDAETDLPRYEPTASL